MDKRLKIILLFLVLAAGIMAGCSTGAAPTQGIQIGNLAPEFTFPNDSGQSVSLSGLRGKPVMLNFWASWCGPCRAEMPLIQEIFEDKEWTDGGLAILAVNLGENPSEVQNFMQANGFTFPVLLDTSENTVRLYNIRGIPTTFFIDKAGIIQDIKVGSFSSREEIEGKLSKITE